MSVKDSVASLELRMEHIGARMNHYDEGMRMQSNNEEVALKMKVGLIVGEIKRRTSEDIECLTEEFRKHRNSAHNELDFIKERLNKLEALEARVEELENAEADTRWNAPDNNIKPEKFIKVKNSHCQVSLLRLNNLDAIQSCWDEEEDQQIPGEIIFNPSGIVKTYSDKEAWQHDLNKIEWFIYDDALLLDLTDLVAPERGMHWNHTNNHHDICPICRERMVYYATENRFMGEAKLMCTKCNYKES